MTDCNALILIIKYTNLHCRFFEIIAQTKKNLYDNDDMIILLLKVIDIFGCLLSLYTAVVTVVLRTRTSLSLQ